MCVGVFSTNAMSMHDAVEYCRDVTKFEFEFDNVRTYSTDSKFDECFKRFVVECEFVEKSLFYD